VDNAGHSSDSKVVKDSGEDLDDGCIISVTNIAPPYGAVAFLVLGLLLLASGLFAHAISSALIALSIFPLSMALFFARNTRRMGADIVITHDAVFRRRGSSVYDIAEWKHVAEIELNRASGARGGPVYTAYHLVMKPDQSGRQKPGFGVARIVLHNPGRLIRCFNHYAVRYDIPIVANNRFTRRNLVQIPLEEIDWDQISLLTGKAPSKTS
jgi:hypothetical protein